MKSSLKDSNRMKNVLICATPDLNFIDGSSVWLQTISLILAETGNLKIDFIAKSPISRYELYQPLIDNKCINIIDGTNPSLWKGRASKRLTRQQLGILAQKLDDILNYDLILVRGLDIAKQLLDSPLTLSKCWIYLTDIPQKLDEYSEELRSTISKIAMGCAKILCQTKEFCSLWQQLEPKLPSSKLEIYSPVIADFDPKKLSRLSQRAKTVIYAGKYTTDWKTLEMATLWPEIQKEVPESDLKMIGDKIHNEVSPENYVEKMKSALESTQGLTWMGALSRSAVQKQFQKARVGLSWRSESLDQTIEYSTKILEYGGCGCAVILNRNSLHESLLGNDYPLFANTEEEYRNQLKVALTDDVVAEKAKEKIVNLSLEHTFTKRVNILKKWVDDVPMSEPKKRVEKTVVLIAGHDLKFVTLLQQKLHETGAYEFIVDKWQGHNKHDYMRSMALLDRADVIFCEWCLGNLQWYSHNKLPWQKLVARFHAQEINLPYLSESNWNRIDRITFVSEHTRKDALAKVAFPVDKTSVIANFVDPTKFTRKKKTGEAKYTLGMIGAAPKSKRLDRAIDLLEALLEKDNRFILRVKGNHPLSYDWLLKRDDELTYYENIFRKLNSNPKLRYKVIFDPPDDNINDWLTLVGHILSPSDHESFHMAIGEGILTGANPIIWDWNGARDIWGDQFIVNDTDGAVNKLLNYNPDTKIIPNNLAKPAVIIDQWKSCILEL